MPAELSFWFTLSLERKAAAADNEGVLMTEICFPNHDGPYVSVGIIAKAAPSILMVSPR